VFADLAGSTALQEQLDPESARRVMTRFYEQMRSVLEAHGGLLEKFIGDAVVAVFGRPSVREDDALRAVRAAAAMVVALESLNDELERDWGVRLRMRTGVNTGELVVSDGGALVGDTMNTAARLEQAAPEGQVLIGEETWRLTRHVIDLEETAPLAVKGKAQPLRAWRVGAVGAVDRRRVSAVEAPLVGREPELARLRDAFVGAVAGRVCRLVSVVGSPGVGKTRLIREFSTALGGEALVVAGHCEPTGEGITFLPVAEILRAVAGIGEADPGDVVRDKLAALVAEDDPDRDRLVERVAGVLGVAEPASAEETFWALRRAIESLSRDRPLVLVLDDLHWGQPMLLDLVEHLVEWVRDAPVLLVALARPELREARGALVSAGRRAVEVIELEPLDERQSLELADGLLGEIRVPATLRTRVLEVTEGNPLFLGETLRMLIDESALRREDGVWVAGEGLGTVDVPPTIHALLAARLERLRADERSVVERASVIGRQFYRGAVAELVAPPVAAEIDAHLEALRRKDMVEPEGTYWIDEPVYRFHHALIRDAAYRSLLKEARSELHERFADWLQAKAGELVGEHEEVIAFHLEQAHEYRRELGPLDDRGRELGRRAAERLRSAGRRALAREDLAAAANLLGRALARDAGPPAEILWDLCDATLSAGDTTSASGLIERYAAEAQRDSGLAPRAVVLRGQLANLSGVADVAATVRELIGAANALVATGDVEGEARAHQAAAGAYARLWQVGAVEEALDRALAAARRSGDRRRTTAVLAAAPRAALWGPSPVVRASGRCLDVVRILRMTPGNRHVEAVALRCQAVLEAMRGRHDAARDILVSGRATLEELGLAFELGELSVHAGIVELLAGDALAASEHLSAARAAFERLGAAAGAAQAAALLARALVKLGDPGAAAEAIEQTEFAEAHSGEDLKTVVIWRSARAEALSLLGRLDEAVALARDAMALSEPTDALADKADAAMALAEVLHAAGLHDDATAIARSATEWYAAKGHLVGTERARRLAGAWPARSDTASTPGAARTALGDRPPGRFYARFKEYFDAHDVEALVSLYPEDCRFVDHRSVGVLGDVRGREGMSELHASVFAEAPNIRFEIDEVLACDERVIAIRVGFRGSGIRAGEYEDRGGYVTAIDGRGSLHTEEYDYDDTRAMIVRYVGLGGGLAPLSDRSPERWLRRLAGAHAAQDRELLPSLYAEDYTFADHRQIGWEPTETRGGTVERIESIWAGAAEVHLEVHEVLACDDRVIAVRLTAEARADADVGAGRLVIPMCAVIAVGGRQAQSWDQYEPEDHEVALARFAELTGGPVRAGRPRSGRRGDPLLGDRPPERFYVEWIRRWESGDLDALAELYSATWVLVEHRPLAAVDEVRGAAGRRALFDSIRHAAPDARFEIDDVLACNERVIALRAAWRGSGRDGAGAFEIEMGLVTVLEGGRQQRIEVFEPDDRRSLIARYSELAAHEPAAHELALPELPAQRAPERYLAEFRAQFNAHDLERCIALTHEDWVQVDHRKVGWGKARGRERSRALLHSVFESFPDIRSELVEVIACDARVVVATGIWRGTDPRGGGAAETPFGMVSVIEGAVRISEDIYEPEDRQAMVARYAELGGGQGCLGRSDAEQWCCDYVRGFATDDTAWLPERFTSDWVLHDHRSMPWDGAQGLEAFAELQRSGFASTLDLRAEVTEVLAVAEGAIAFTMSFLGHSIEGGGPFEVSAGWVVGLEDGRARRTDVFEPDDRGGMLARHAELQSGGGEDPASWLARHDRVSAGQDGEVPAELIDPGVVVRDRRWSPGVDEVGVDAYRTLVASGTRTQVLVAEDNLRLARTDDDPPLLLVMEIRDTRLVEVIGLRDESRAGEWLAALRNWRAYEAASRAGDIEGLLAHEHAHARLVDHRPLKFQDAENREGIRAIYAGFGELLSGAGAAVEVLEVFPGATLVSITWRGTARHGGGPVEWLTYHASRLSDGLYLESHTFSDHQSALGKLEELRT
jgi:class 3 adenylate cyclase